MSAFVSHSFAAIVPSFGSWLLAVIVASLRSVMTVDMIGCKTRSVMAVDSHGGDSLLLCLFLSCSFLPPIIEDFACVIWLTVLFTVPQPTCEGTSLDMCERNSFISALISSIALLLDVLLS